MMIEGWGVAVDRVISDFVQGTVEWLLEQAEARGDWVSSRARARSTTRPTRAVTLGLIHGATPHAMVMVHKPGLAEHDFDHLPDARSRSRRCRPFIELHERMAGLVAPSKVVAIALNTSLYPADDEARRVDRGDRSGDRPPDRRPGPLRGRPPLGRRSATRSRRCRGSDA